jgi:amidase
LTRLRVSRDAKTFRYSSDQAPAAVVEPGQIFDVETTSAVGEFSLTSGADLDGLPSELCNPLTGPIAVRGARPGEVLQVHVDAMALQGRGMQGVIPGIGILDWPRPLLAIHDVDEDEILFGGDLRLAKRPNIGCLGVAPAGGALPSVAQGDHGGNLDTRYVCAGSVIELPVFHPDALLFLGDCHPLQADGALGGMPPEMDALVTLRCTVRRDGHALRRPRILTGRRIMFLASAATLEEAAAVATQDLVDALVAEKGLGEDDAYLLTTVQADLEVCQVVNALRTVRVCMDRRLYDELSSASASG